MLNSSASLLRPALVHRIMTHGTRLIVLALNGLCNWHSHSRLSWSSSTSTSTSLSTEFASWQFISHKLAVTIQPQHRSHFMSVVILLLAGWFESSWTFPVYSLVYHPSRYLLAIFSTTTMSSSSLFFDIAHQASYAIDASTIFDLDNDHHYAASPREVFPLTERFFVPFTRPGSHLLWTRKVS